MALVFFRRSLAVEPATLHPRARRALLECKELRSQVTNGQDDFIHLVLAVAQLSMSSNCLRKSARTLHTRINLHFKRSRGLFPRDGQPRLVAARKNQRTDRPPVAIDGRGIFVGVSYLKSHAKKLRPASAGICSASSCVPIRRALHPFFSSRWSSCG